MSVINYLSERTTRPEDGEIKGRVISVVAQLVS